MSMLKNFTIAMKRFATGMENDTGYCTETEWTQFYNEMKDSYPDAFRQYSEGDGGELTAKNGRPPKMASYASSSRMIYLLSRENTGFVFEKKLSTTVGGIANLDGYLETQSRQFLVEAKCREPYGHGAAVSVSEKYRTYYEHLNRSCPGGLSCEMQTEKDGRMRVEYRLHGHPISGFDMKQMLCHLLGAATGLLEGTLPPKPIEFLYLLYDPSFLPLQEREKERIMAAYHRHCLEAAAVDFEAVFACTLDFLAGKPVEREYVFRFTPCDQRQYAALLRTAGDN